MIIVRIIGGLGNQMFQYALYKNLKTNYSNVKGDIHGYEKYTLHGGFTLEKVFNTEVHIASITEIESVTNLHKTDVFSKIIRKSIGNKSTHIYENEFYWEMINSIDNFYLDGYWQSEKYFGDVDLLKSDFIFKSDLDKNNLETEQLIKSCKSVSMHVRRGDYIGNSVYTHLDREYYIQAMNLIKTRVENPVFFIFSDDSFWVKNNFIFELQSYANIVFVENNTSCPEDDMQMMSLCKHNIIANSSFSWWGAWLNNNDSKIVVAPKQWYNNPTININHIKQLPNTWIKI